MYNAYVPRGGASVTPSDTVDIVTPYITTALYIGTGGTLAIITEDGSALTYPVIGAGTILSMRVKRVMSTGTTAADIIAHY